MYTIHTIFYEGYARGTWRLVIYLRDAHQQVKDCVCELAISKDNFTYNRELMRLEPSEDMSPAFIREVTRKVAESFTNSLEMSQENAPMRTRDWIWNKKAMSPKFSFSTAVKLGGAAYANKRVEPPQIQAAPWLGAQVPEWRVAVAGSHYQPPALQQQYAIVLDDPYVPPAANQDEVRWADVEQEPGNEP